MTIAVEKFQWYNHKRSPKPQKIKIYSCLFQSTKFWKSVTPTKAKYFNNRGFLMVLEETEIPIQKKPPKSGLPSCRTADVSSLRDEERTKRTAEKLFRKSSSINSPYVTESSVL